MPITDIEKHRKYQREWLMNRRDEWFKDKCCIDCKTTDNLELDHIEYTKKVSHNIWSWSAERRKTELSKCVVRCHDCHKIKTQNNMEYYHIFTPDQIREIRTKYQTGKYLQKDLAIEYNVNFRTINKIINYITYKNC